MWFLAALALLITGPALATEVSTATGKTITFDGTTGLATVEGDAMIENSTATITADKIDINTKTKHGRAEGNVKMVQSSSTLIGTAANYSYDTSTGTIENAYGISDQMAFEARELIQRSPQVYDLIDGYVTTCTDVPPHYRIRARRGRLYRGKRIKLYNARMMPDETPVFYTPFYTKSLIPKKWRLRIEPGYTSRDGNTVKTIFGYPFSENTWTDFRWDYLQKTGNGGGIVHRYSNPNIRGQFDGYYIRDSNPDKEVPRSKRYTVLWNHYQKLTSKLTANAKFDLKSDQTFGFAFPDAGNGVLVENQQRGLLSEAGFTYLFKAATLDAQFSRKDKFDQTVSSKQFVSQIVFPRLALNTAPLKPQWMPFYTQFSGVYTVSTPERDDPDVTLRYLRTGNAGVEIKKDFSLKKKLSLTPLASYNQTWQNRILGSTQVITEKDQYVGHYAVGLDTKLRITRSVDLAVGYRYNVRNRLNQTLQDLAADDHGVELNQLTGSVNALIGRSTRLTLSSGYDYRDAPKSRPQQYRLTNARITPPSLDLQWEARKNVNVYFRETYSIYNPDLDRVIHTPLNTSGEVQFGDTAGHTFFSQGFSYTKTPQGQPATVILNNKLRFYVTKKWYADAMWSYRAVGGNQLDYRKVYPIEHSLRVVRDMHCWIFTMEFISQPGRTEANFHIDLKTGGRTKDAELFDKTREGVVSTRNDRPNDQALFPAQ